MRRRAIVTTACTTAVLLVIGVGVMTAQGSRARALLQPTQEVPAVSSNASGTFSATISRDLSTVSYTLQYRGLQGEVTQAHIHIGQFSVNGGIMVWLCETAGTQSPDPNFNTECPQSGTVTGEITAANVTPNGGAVGQGIAEGQFREFLRALRLGVAYANVHSTKFGGGEVRGQIGF